MSDEPHRAKSVPDLMAALKASLDEIRAKDGEGEREDETQPTEALPEDEAGC